MADEILIQASPYDFRCDPDKTALIVIDMQGDFCLPGGFAGLLGNDVTRTREIIPAIQHLLERFRALKLPVIHTREGHKPDLSDLPASKLRRTRMGGAGIGDEGPLGRILIRGEKGHDIIPECYPRPGEPVFDKPGKGSFYDTGLDEYLKASGMESLIVAGVTTHVCVSTTVKEANDRGYECLVLEDATAAYSVWDHESALRTIRQHGAIFGWVGSSDAVLSSLPVPALP